jgi:hypothetical protein
MTTLSGEYSYWHKGERQPVKETFFKFVSDDYIKINAQRHAHPYRIFVDVHGTRASALSGGVTFMGEKALVAHYACGEHLLFNRTVDTIADEPITLALPAFYVFAPLMRIFIAPTIRALVANGGHGTVIVPNIHNPQDHANLLKPILEERSAQWLYNESTSVQAGTFDTECFSYTGGNYDAEARFWLMDNVLVRYTFQDWDVQLEWLKNA